MTPSFLSSPYGLSQGQEKNKGVISIRYAYAGGGLGLPQNLVGTGAGPTLSLKHRFQSQRT